MKTMIQYSYFEDKDADGVATLMVKNNFWMGKYNRSLDGKTFREYQNAKGFCFGVVGKIDEKYVTYVAAYKLGSQRAANSRQIVMSGLIIDEAYRSSVFSISDMFMLVLAKVREMGCTEMISEVGKNNKLSLFMMKKTGFVVLDDRPTIYGEVILRNYLPAVLDCVWSDSMPDSSSLANGMQSINKRNLLQPVEYLNSHVIITTWSVGKDRFEFLIDILSGEVVGIRCVGFFSFQLSGERRFVLEREKSMKRSSLQVNMYAGEKLEKTVELTEGDVRIPESVTRLTIKTDAVPYTFALRQFVECQVKKEQLEYGYNFDYSADLGAVFFPGRSNSQFAALWPSMNPPYLEGLLEQNVEKDMEFQKDSDQEFTQKEICEAGTLERVYHHEGERLKISTRLLPKEEKEEPELSPLFPMGIFQEEYRIRVSYTDGTRKEYTQQQELPVFAELIFVDFKNDGTENKKADQVQVEVENVIYCVRMDAPFACTVNKNYLAIHPSYKKEGEWICFPDMEIVRERC